MDIGQQVLVLRAENVTLRRQLEDKQCLITALQSDLSEASARISDIIGELSEEQKQEIETCKETLGKRETEIRELRQQLMNYSRIIRKQREVLRIIDADLNSEKSASLKFKGMLEKEIQRSKKVEQSLEMEMKIQKKQIEFLENDKKVWTELAQEGAQCRGERHLQIIVKQREALAELRLKVRVTEAQKKALSPPIPNEQAMQEIITLKKELAELRANKELEDLKSLRNVFQVDSCSGVCDKGISTDLAFSALDMQMEVSAHRETMETLIASEDSFLRTFHAIAATLDLDYSEGMLPLAHLPRDERNSLLHAREKSCEKMVKQIRAYLERIDRKDKLLHNYEKDLGKLQEAEELAKKRSVQLDLLVDDVRTKTAETILLREWLHDTREKLDQKIRLGTEFTLTKVEQSRGKRAEPSHSCKLNNPKTALKRKNYYVETLTKKLAESKQRLQDTKDTSSTGIITRTYSQEIDEKPKPVPVDI